MVLQSLQQEKKKEKKEIWLVTVSHLGFLISLITRLKMRRNRLKNFIFKSLLFYTQTFGLWATVMVKLSDLEAVQEWVRTGRVMHSLVPASTKLPDLQTYGNKNMEMATSGAQVVLALDFKEGKKTLPFFPYFASWEVCQLVTYFTVLNYSKYILYPSKKHWTNR